MMQLSGLEYKFKVEVSMRDAKKGLKLCDALRNGMLAYLEDEGEDKLPEIEGQWAEFCAIAFDANKFPLFADVDPHRIIEALQGFTQARSKVSA
jgi:hypothetical protein